MKKKIFDSTVEFKIEGNGIICLIDDLYCGKITNGRPNVFLNWLFKKVDWELLFCNPGGILLQYNKLFNFLSAYNKI